MRFESRFGIRGFLPALLVGLLLGGCGGSTSTPSDDPPPPPQAECDPQPPTAGGTIGPAGTYVKMKASTYGTSGTGLFVQVDVGDPSVSSPYTGRGLANVWVETGDASLACNWTIPSGPPNISSGVYYPLTGTPPRSWGGGCVVDRPGSNSMLRVFVELRLERSSGAPFDTRLFCLVEGVTNPELPTGWEIVTEQP